MGTCIDTSVDRIICGSYKTCNCHIRISVDGEYQDGRYRNTINVLFYSSRTNMFDRAVLQISGNIITSTERFRLLDNVSPKKLVQRVVDYHRNLVSVVPELGDWPLGPVGKYISSLCTRCPVGLTGEVDIKCLPVDYRVCLLGDILYMGSLWPKHKDSPVVVDFVRERMHPLLEERGLEPIAACQAYCLSVRSDS